MQLEAAFSRLTKSFAAQRAQLDQFAREQQVQLRICSHCKKYHHPVADTAGLSGGLHLPLSAELVTKSVSVCRAMHYHTIAQVAGPRPESDVDIQRVYHS